MTIASRTTAVTLVGNGSNRNFSFTFRAWEGELRVVITDPEDQATDVTAASTIVLAANSLGGIVTYPAATGSPALKDGWKLTIMRDMDFLQPVALVNATRWNPEVIEQEFDRLTAMAQQLREMADRALSVAAGAETGAAELLEGIYNIERHVQEIAAQIENTAAQAEASAQSAAQSKARAEQAIAEAESAVASAKAAAEAAVAASEDIIEHENLAYQWAQNPENMPVRENPDTGEDEFSAYHWAKKAAVGNIPTATEVDEGVMRFGTAAEHEAGANGVAAQPGEVRKMLFENAGAGPKLRTDILPLATLDTPGVVRPDGTTVTVTDGVLSAPLPYFKKEFTASGSWTPSALGMYRIRGCAGGGGGGGVYVGDDRGAAGGGASGEEVDMYINITSLAAIPITIGAGGNGGTATSTANANGAAGGDTTFGSYFTLNGGLGGTGLYLATPAGARAAYPGGVSSGPGSSSGGNALFSLQSAGTYMLTQVFGGVGGASSFGAPGQIVAAGNTSVSNPGIAATGYGAGGGGAACNSQRAAGGEGAPGYILIERVG